MNKSKLLLKEETNRMIELAGGNPVANKHLVVIDIQPEYKNGFDYFLSDFIEFLNQNYSEMAQLTFFYNGSDTVGGVNENEYRMWWFDNGLDEEIIESVRFYDKGYAFFRYCIDKGISHDITVRFVRYMIDKGVNDSRDMTKQFWNEYVKRFGDKDIRELLEFADDAINIPELMDEIKHYNNIVICGGGINECLKEVEIALDALEKPYNVLTKFTY